MTSNDLLVASVNYDDGKHVRKIGRYYASECHAIRKGYLLPEDFFKKREIDLEGAKNITGGNSDEEGWAVVLERNKVKHVRGDKLKREIKITDNIVLVVKPDFLINDEYVLETKSPTKITRGIPEKWKDQLECEYRAFNLPVYLGVFRNNPTRRFDLEEFAYKPSSRRWESIQKTLVEFDKKLRQII